MQKHSAPIFRLRHVNRITRGDKVYYYHRKTGRRLPADPSSTDFLAAVLAENEKCGRSEAMTRAVKKTAPVLTHIYFIRAGEVGPIKIGIARNVARRLDTLQISHYQPLHLLAAVPGGADAEQALHARFEHIRIRGEWFAPDRSLLDFIEGLGRKG